MIIIQVVFSFPPDVSSPSVSPSVGGVPVRACEKKRIVFFMIWAEKASLASANVQFNDLAFQRYKGGCIRSLAARNYADFLFFFWGGGCFV